MASSGTNLERQSVYKEAFLASLSRSIAIPTDEWPTVRVWMKTSLNRMFKSVKDEVGESKPPLSNLELLGWMEKLGLTWTIDADGVTFYLLEMGAGSASKIDPLELMMAYEPSGVVCYFSALAFHSLTSQMPSHHHVAVLTESPKADHLQGGGEENEAREEIIEEGQRGTVLEKKAVGDKGVRSKASPFGRVAFSYSGVCYYLTRRTKRLIPGVQNRSQGPRGRFRITTYEQSLLDTLYKPQNCGGPAVVLEAWQEATTSGRLDEERLVDYLARMDYPSTTRRVGAILQLMGYYPGDELKSYLDQAKKNIDRAAPYSQISLLPGFDYSNLDEEWLVKSP
jgi:predicted transcriptional regulator of viral defense system